MNLIIVALLFAVVYYLFIMKHQNENFAGVANENPFTNLTCLHENPDDPKSAKHIFKVSPSLNNSNGFNTFHKLLHPDKISKTDGTQYVNYDDLVQTGDSPKCNDGEISSYFVKKIRDENSKVRSLFNKINSGQKNTNKSTWQQHECTVTDINNNTHWCNKIHSAILNNVDKICSTKPDNVPANYCSKFKDEKLGFNAYISTNDKLINQVNYLQQRGTDSITQKIRNVGSVPQETTTVLKIIMEIKLIQPVLCVIIQIPIKM